MKVNGLTVQAQSRLYGRFPFLVDFSLPKGSTPESVSPFRNQLVFQSSSGSRSWESPTVRVRKLGRPNSWVYLDGGRKYTVARPYRKLVGAAALGRDVLCCRSAGVVL